MNQRNASIGASRRSVKRADRTRQFVGQVRRVENLAQTYRSLSIEDEQAAQLLARDGHHRQAVYFLIQAMEKATLYGIYSEVSPSDTDATGLSYGERTRTHFLDELLALLLEVYTKAIDDPRVIGQIEEQMATSVLEGVRFGHLHNNVRYPRILEGSRSPSLLELAAKDSQAVAAKLDRLRSFVSGFQQFKQANETTTQPSDRPTAFRF